jgi:hypothetical protein
LLPALPLLLLLLPTMLPCPSVFAARVVQTLCCTFMMKVAQW